MENLRDTALQIHKANLERLLALCHSTIESTDRLASLHLNTARALIEDVASGAKQQLAGKGEGQNPLATATDAIAPLVEKAAAYSRELFDIMSQVHERFDAIYHAQHADAHQHLTAALERAHKSAPAGMEAPIAALQSAVAVSKKAHDGMTDAAHQAAALTKATVAKTLDQAEQSIKKTTTGKGKKA